MYTPPAFDGTRQADLWLPMLLHRDPFVTLLTHSRDETVVSHLPVLARRGDGGKWRLFGHWARSNPQWQGAADRPALAIVHGPHGYVSPRWYPDPARSVPTWNYAVAHLHGRIDIVGELSELLALVDDLSSHFEAGAASPWRREASDPALAGMVRGIVGFRLDVERIELQVKFNQHHPARKVRGAIEGLVADGSHGSREIARWMAIALDIREAEAAKAQTT